jgi:hypothetical protein
VSLKSTHSISVPQALSGTRLAESTLAHYFFSILNDNYKTSQMPPQCLRHVQSTS